MHSFANRIADAVIVRPCSYRKGALPRRRKHDVSGKPISYAVAEAQPYEAGNGQHDGSPILRLIQLSEAGSDIAPKVDYLEIPAFTEKLGATSKATRGDHRPLGDLTPSKSTPSHQGVASIFPTADR